MKLEIKNIFRFPSGRYVPCGLNIYDKMWWRFMPGEVINVRWPIGWVILHETSDGDRTSVESVDPNDHYRPELERLVGKQGWDWNWGLANNDVAANRLTIKIRKKHAPMASYFMLKWS